MYLITKILTFIVMFASVYTKSVPVYKENSTTIIARNVTTFPGRSIFVLNKYLHQFKYLWF